MERSAGRLMRLRRIFLAIGFLSLLGGGAEAQVRVDDKAARAVLEALGDPHLSKADAEAVAHLPGNQALIRKIGQMYGQPSSEAGFAEALIAAAQGDEKVTPYRFARVKKSRLTTLKLLDDIEGHPEAFAQWVETRIAAFTPSDVKPKATGYLVAGGGADGFAFETSDFYMNVTPFGDEVGSARVIMAHELYHGVQNLAAKTHPRASQAFDFDNSAYKALKARAARDCYATRAYFTSLVAEGTATLVGSPELLPKEGAYADTERRRRQGGFGDLESQRTLLEMSLKTITGPAPMNESRVYQVGFYGSAPMYDLGFAMAKAIAASDGDAAIGRFISEPPENFVRRYIALTKLDSKLPALGPIATRWASRTGCPG